jgi:hypothetical protein
MYDTYVVHKTISLPEDVLPIIESLGVPFSQWVAKQLRLHAIGSSSTFAEQLVADALLAQSKPPTSAASRSVGKQMEQSAPW